MEVPIELSEDCYCNLSVPIPNEQTSGNAFAFIHNPEYTMYRQPRFHPLPILDSIHFCHSGPDYMESFSPG